MLCYKEESLIATNDPDTYGSRLKKWVSVLANYY